MCTNGYNLLLYVKNDTVRRITLYKNLFFSKLSRAELAKQDSLLLLNSPIIEFSVTSQVFNAYLKGN